MSKSHKYVGAGFTQIELIVVVVLIALLIWCVLPTISRSKNGSNRTTCLNNLRQIDIAYRVWATDNHDLLPAQATCPQGGWKDLLTNGAGGSYCWTNFSLMHTELGESPRIVVCPFDERRAAVPSPGAPTSGYAYFGNTTFSNKSLSYFVGVGANNSFPHSILAGDRNLCAGPTPDKKYGFSPENGMGNDVTIGTNSATSPLSWSLKLHSEGQSEFGNILFADGSAQHCTSAQLREYQGAALDSGNWPSNAIPKAPSFRLVFP